MESLSYPERSPSGILNAPMAGSWQATAAGAGPSRGNGDLVVLSAAWLRDLVAEPDGRLAAAEASISARIAIRLDSTDH
jgi:hypothetical protein